jgi:chemotaxis protein histidine kinase CheA
MVESGQIGGEHEFRIVLAELDAAAARLAPDAVPGAQSATLAQYAVGVDRVAEVAGDQGLLALLDVCLLYRRALEPLLSGADLNVEMLKAINVWPDLVGLYLRQRDLAATATALIVHLRKPCWNLQLNADDVQGLSAAFAELSGHSGTTPGLLDVATVVDRSDKVIADDDPALDGGADLFAASQPIADAPPLMAAAPPAERQLSPTAYELLSVIVSELPEVDIAIAMLMGVAGTPAIEFEVVDEAFANALSILARLGAAADSVGMAGLGRICANAGANIEALQVERGDTAPLQPEMWAQFVPAVRAYLADPLDLRSIAGLVDFAADPRHRVPLDGPAFAEAEALLAAPDFSILEAEGPARPSVAADEDVSLAIPEDVNPELLEGLLQELPQQTEEFSAAIQRMIQGGTLEDVNIAQRVAHTLKGAGNTVGVRGLAELTHHLEDVLLALASHEVLPTRTLSESLMNAADCLEGMAEYLAGTGPAPADRRQVLQNVLDWANLIDRDGPPSDDRMAVTQGIDAALVEADAPHTSTSPAEHAPESLASAAGSAVERDAGGAMLRVPAQLVDNLLRMVGEAIILSSQLHDGVRRTQQQARSMEDQFEHLRLLGGELERLVDVEDFSAAPSAQQRSGEFDPLEMDQYSELHTYSRRLIEAALDAREMGRGVIGNLAQLDDMLTTQETLNRETQEGVLNTRLVPVKSIFPRLHRSARQASRLSGKRMELRLTGGETLMDSDVLARVVDPLMHLLRNSIDHGIEPPETRIARGKNATGEVMLEFGRDGNNILVSCRDDGGGLDYEAIRNTARKRGLLAEGEDAGEEALKNFILQPNFTTRAQVSQTSGRGIGLDAVYSRVVELGGSLTMQSKAGVHCVMEARLPVTLLSSHALLVKVGTQTVALTTRGIEQIVHIEDGDLRQFGSELVFQSKEQIYAAQALDAVLGVGPALEYTAQLALYRSALIVRASNGLVAVLVESVVASRELVVKTLGIYIPRLRGIVGATILGDGSVTPVIDVAETLRSPVRVAGERTTTSHGMTGEQTLLPVAMVVDDSLSARRSLAQLLVDSGFKVVTASDGLDAVDQLDKTQPDIMFVDLEMPRMNGIELTAHVRSRAITAKVPVIMVTSRSTAKHRQQAADAGVNVYLTKPFAEEALLDQTRMLLGNA